MKYSCTTCGKEVDSSVFSSIQVELEGSQFCFDCKYWADLARTVSEDRNLKNLSVRINGVHYLIQPYSGPMLGMGGASHKIRFFDGRKVKTNNLWQQGRIPDTFKSLLPDNAVFFSGEV